MEMTKKLPKEAGYYWYCDFGEHTPCVLEVTKHRKQLYAQNEEFSFRVKREKNTLWARIPNPIIDGEVVEPRSY